MAQMQKVTVTLPASQVATIRDLVASGQADSVSGFVQHAVAVSLDDIAGWGAMLARALQDTGGAMTARERRWADGLLGGSSPAA